MRRGECSAQDLRRGQRIEPPEHNRREGFRSRHHLYRDFLERGERPEGASHQLAKIIAGDVFDDFAACLKDFATSADSAKAEEMVACGTRFDTARPRKIAGQRTPKGTRAIHSCGLAKKRPKIWWLE